jgi:hypothetical protein
MAVIKDAVRKLVRWARPVDELTAWKKRLAEEYRREFELAYECRVHEQPGLLAPGEQDNIAVRIRQLERLENLQNTMGARPRQRVATLETKRNLRS